LLAGRTARAGAGAQGLPRGGAGQPPGFPFLGHDFFAAMVGVVSVFSFFEM